MKPTEIVFFAIAFLLPLIGGGVLLYLITRAARARGNIDDSRQPTPAAPAAPPAPATDAHDPHTTRETPEENE
jgi:hypothetical protein